MGARPKMVMWRRGGKTINGVKDKKAAGKAKDELKGDFETKA